MPRYSSLPALIAIGLVSSWSAAAQTASQQPGTPPGIWDQDTLTGDWGGLRTRLTNDGITLGLQEQSEGWANLTGGFRRGVTYDGLTTASLQIDLAKLVGWSGATFFVDFLQIHGHGPSDSMVGNLQLISNIEATDSNKLYAMWLEQALLNGRLNIRIGQEGAGDEMMIADDAAMFIDSSFGFPASPTTDLPDGGPNYPMATPFVRVRYQATDAITLVTAAYNGDPAPPGTGDPQLRDHTGTAFRLNDHALLFWEVWYSRNKGDNAPGLPGTYKLGVWYDSARFSDVLFDNTGLSLANAASSGTPLGHDGDYAVYGIADQTVWRRPGDSGESLAAFLQVMGAPADRNLSNLFVEAGLNWKAPFGCSNDSAGIAVSYEGIGGVARRFSKALAALSGFGATYASNETVIEATYIYHIAPWWNLQPDAQYVVNPGANISSSFSSRPLKNAFVLGVRATITF
ncbi:MAG TPA: carbohydrate porin [Acetobacteraceae bacterium]|nr:carbohydrate porin [Acetobacteraceae bacterium]